MRVRDLEPYDTFHHVGGNRKYRYYGDDLGDDSNDTFVMCVLTSVPYVIDLDVEVECINQEDMTQ